jgi:hypothetical protein
MCLLASLLFAWVTRNGRMAFAAAVLMGNWLACWTWAQWQPSLAMSPVALTAFDGAAAVVLLIPALRRRAPDWYLAIVALYFVQLLAHLAAMFVPNADHPHWLSLSALAWAQLAVVWAGGGYELGRSIAGVLGDLGGNGAAVQGDGRTSRGGHS